MVYLKGTGEKEMAVDPAALKAAFQTVARLAKLSLTVVATAVLVSMTNTGGFDATDSAARQQGRMGEWLRQAIMFIPSPSGDIIVRQVCLPFLATKVVFFNVSDFNVK
jgi:hypothetical protein